MFYVVSCKIEVGRISRKEVFVCPKKWIKKGVLYWPEAEKKVKPAMQCKNWKNYKFSTNWPKFPSFKILRNNQEFADFEDASLVEREELKIATEASDSSSSSDNEGDDEDEELTSKSHAEKVVISSSSVIPPIMKRPPCPNMHFENDSQIQTTQNGNPSEKTENTQVKNLFQDTDILNASQVVTGQDLMLNGNNNDFVTLYTEPLTRNEGHASNAGNSFTAFLDGNTSGHFNAQANLQNISHSIFGSISSQASQSQDRNSDSLESLMKDLTGYQESDDLTLKLSEHLNQTVSQQEISTPLEQNVANIVKLLGFVALKVISMDRRQAEMQTLLITPKGGDIGLVDSEIPVDSVDKLESFEENLNDEMFRASLVRALCYKHVDRAQSLTTIVFSIVNNIVTQSVLKEFTYIGDSRLNKPYKLIEFKNVVSLINAVFVFAASEGVEKYELPSNKKLNSALSAAVRHASERVKREEGKNQKRQQQNKN
ncbi:hypothetical protein ACFFRR_010715 [Megaselia abdita]